MQNTFTGTPLALRCLKIKTEFWREQRQPYIQAEQAGEPTCALCYPAHYSEQKGQGNTPGKYLSLTYALLLLHSSDRPFQRVNYRTPL